jgi:hypothetical protein
MLVVRFIAALCYISHNGGLGELLYAQASNLNRFFDVFN